MIIILYYNDNALNVLKFFGVTSGYMVHDNNILAEYNLIMLCEDFPYTVSGRKVKSTVSGIGLGISIYLPDIDRAQSSTASPAAIGASQLKCIIAKYIV